MKFFFLFFLIKKSDDALPFLGNEDVFNLNSFSLKKEKSTVHLQKKMSNKWEASLLIFWLNKREGVPTVLVTTE